MADINVETLLGALGLARKDSSDSVAPVMGAFLIGGLVGAGLALLFAPKSGEKLRDDLRDRVGEAKDDLMSMYKKKMGHDEDESSQDGPRSSPAASTSRPTGY
jgi:hypothetical protein